MSAGHHAVGLLILSLATFSLTCAPPPPTLGAECPDGAAACNGPRDALVCVGNRFVATPCGGPRGCTVDEERSIVHCDESVAQIGDACWPGSWSTSGRNACSRDRKQALICDGAKYNLLATCKGPTGCTNKSPMIECDNRIADEGDPCIENGAACASNGGALLACRARRFVVEAACHGPKGCHEGTTGIQCDNSIAAAGDPCIGTGGVACSADHVTLLKCVADKMTVVLSCSGKAGCAVENSTVRCDQSIAAVGDTCDEGPACTADGKQMLGCKDGKRVVERTCAKACEVRVAEHVIDCR